MAEALVDGRGSGNYVGVDETNRLMTVGSITSMPPITTLTDEFIQRIDYSGTTSPIMIGLATPGTNVTAAGWQIKQMNYDGNNLVSGILFASGNTNFDKHWINRYSGPYS